MDDAAWRKVQEEEAAIATLEARRAQARADRAEGTPREAAMELLAAHAALQALLFNSINVRRDYGGGGFPGVGLDPDPENWSEWKDAGQRAVVEGHLSQQALDAATDRIERAERAFLRLR